jgi:[acyl-carrier-protein] S-malonyltransferase
VNNWQAREIRTGDEARQGLLEQVPNPVRWTESVRRLTAAGVNRAVEVGAGAVLCGLLKSIDPAIQTTRFGEPADLDKVKELLVTLQ